MTIVVIASAVVSIDEGFCMNLGLPIPMVGVYTASSLESPKLGRNAE